MVGGCYKSLRSCFLNIAKAHNFGFAVRTRPLCDALRGKWSLLEK